MLHPTACYPIDRILVFKPRRRCAVVNCTFCNLGHSVTTGRPGTFRKDERPCQPTLWAESVGIHLPTIPCVRRFSIDSVGKQSKRERTRRAERCRFYALVGETNNTPCQTTNQAHYQWHRLRAVAREWTKPPSLPKPPPQSACILGALVSGAFCTPAAHHKYTILRSDQGEKFLAKPDFT